MAPRLQGPKRLLTKALRGLFLCMNTILINNSIAYQFTVMPSRAVVTIIKTNDDRKINGGILSTERARKMYRALVARGFKKEAA